MRRSLIVADILISFVRVLELYTTAPKGKAAPNERIDSYWFAYWRCYAPFVSIYLISRP